MHDLVILGSGGVGRQAAQIVLDINNIKPTWNLLGFLDDNVSNMSKKVAGFPILGTHLWLVDNRHVYVALSIGKTLSRFQAYKRLEKINHTLITTIIHPSSWVGDRTKIGKGSIIYANSVLDPDVNIGIGNIINKNCTVGHDSNLGGFVNLAPGANIAGRVKINRGCDIGINSAVIQDICIGAWTILGAGAVAIEDLPPNVTAVGIPAKVIKRI